VFTLFIYKLCYLQKTRAINKLFEMKFKISSAETLLSQAWIQRVWNMWLQGRILASSASSN